MANLTTHSLSFKKEEIAQYFIDAAFIGEDSVPIMSILTDIKGTQTLHDISRPSKITKTSSIGFSANGSIALTNRDVTVSALKAEFEQNGEAFVNSWVEVALAKGFNLDDVEKMTAPAFFNQIILPLVADAIKQDKNRQLWFADVNAEVGLTGAADTDLNVYTGLWTNFLNDVNSGTIPSSQVIAVTDGSGTKMTQTATVSGLSTGILSVKVNGIDYDTAWHTNINTTVADWLAAHKSAIEARGKQEMKVTVTAATSVITIAANFNGGQVAVAAGDNLDGTGTITVATTVVHTAAADLVAGQATDTMDEMIDAIPEAALDYEADMVFICTRSFYRNYIKELQDVTHGIEAAYVTMQDGKKIVGFDGKPLVVKPDWDLNIRNEIGGVKPHRCILTYWKNLIFATDGANDDKAISTWYNEDEEMRRYRVKYRANTTYRSSDLLVLAY
jgi:hypothetical protein